MRALQCTRCRRVWHSAAFNATDSGTCHVCGGELRPYVPPAPGRTLGHVAAGRPRRAARDSVRD